MAALSHHSSNPMESGLLARYSEYQSSDDPIASYPDTLPDKFREQVAGFMAERPQKPKEEHMVDLDESDDLQAFDQDDTPREVRAYVDEEMEYDEDQDAEGEDDEDVQDVFKDVHGTSGDEEDMEVDWEGIQHEEDDDEPGGVQRTSDDVDCFAIDESEEIQTLKTKPHDEQAEIRQEMQDFKSAVPHLSEDYKLIDRLGTGTFSSVYKAIDLRYHEWDNTPWHGHHPPGSSAHYQAVPHPTGTRVFVAIKRIYVTSGPDRIKNELKLMELCRGCRHVSQVITAFRHEDQVAIVMPYHRNADYRDYFQELPMAGIKEYFRCLMRALRDIHRRGIIHRDVKPANFLFDPRTGQGSLCDFGLAQRFDSRIPTHGSCLHTNSSDEHPHGKYVTKNDYSIEMVKRQQADARWKCKQRGEVIGYPDKDSRVPMKANRAGTRGFRAPEVLFKCGQQNGAVDVWSAGVILLFFLTHKFPLFQANDDIEALMEIAAVLGRSKMEKVATLHCRTFATNIPDIPNEEVTWQEFAERLNPDIYKPRPPNPHYYPYTLPSYKLKLKAETDGQQNSMAVDVLGPKIDVEAGNPFLDATPSSPAESNSTDGPPTTRKAPAASTEASHQKDVKDALNLLELLLHPESVKRITPRDALYHPFLIEKQTSTSATTSTTSTTNTKAKLKGDDAYEPHPFGHGICKDLHFIDAVTEQPGVILRVKKCVCGCAGEGCGVGPEEVEEVRKLVEAGEGLAIGNQPCEFHKDIEW